MNFELRSGSQADKDWLYDLYCRTMRPCIEATWGWDEEFQSNEFNSNLAPICFLIIVFDGENIGGFCLKDNEDHLYLEMILLEPKYQKSGIGKSAMSHIMELAKKNGLPLKLSVIKKNPVKPFYEKLGFSQYDEDESFYRMQWHS
ncbi:MAG: hypothetical protein COB04_17505 [Gammaproteobacteria bacterium]|nr:MAG: hypothetical protein COB04_17505 [Gammaproteobacteria bacterium]